MKYIYLIYNIKQILQDHTFMYTIKETKNVDRYKETILAWLDGSRARVVGHVGEGGHGRGGGGGGAAGHEAAHVPVPVPEHHHHRRRHPEHRQHADHHARDTAAAHALCQKYFYK